MSYLIVEEDTWANFFIKEEISKADKESAKNEEMIIIDLDNKEFYVENDVWQKIPER